MQVCDQQKIERFDAVLYEALGGRDVASMLGQRYVEGMSIRAIAEVRGEPVMTVRAKLLRGRAALERVGLIPKGWKA